MRIAFLCKRQYTGGKDVIVDRYGRLYEVPYRLARLGHTVLALCFSYQHRPRSSSREWAEPGELRWESRSVGMLGVPALVGYPFWVLARLRRFKPDVLIGASDIPHLRMSAWLARHLNLPYAADLYDNFESFAQARIPGMKDALRTAVRRAPLVTAVSEPLAERLREVYRASGIVRVVPNAADESVFFRRDRPACRSRLSLPRSARLIGTAGALHAERGIGTLYRAWQMLAASDSNVHLVLAGPMDRKLPPPPDERVHYLGVLPPAATAELFGALDVGVVCLRDSAFGRYCFPQKLCEMLACGLPLVAARVGAMERLLADAPQCLYRADDAEDLAKRVAEQLNHPLAPTIRIGDWAAVVRGLEQELRTLVSA